MMLTNKQAEYLIKLEKSLVVPDQIIDLRNKTNTIELISYEDSDYSFRLDITSNQKIILKTSIHHMESKSFIGLMRIDFKGTHQNPPQVLDTLPDFLKPYIGKWFEPTEPHLHIYVEGYKPLAWAIPLEDTDFPTKYLNHQSDLNKLIVNFAKEINLKSKINIQQAII
ncbi:DUF6978 family protein [Haloflavibacter putidus]|uniref:Uncharacterized protein n=1 Tax=Haloflavibacter putidus TaxID=2576776 RepID=A0A507ZHK0_9FLAO|nr:hypothetical protein [Haloflavibacter putidus]TQD36251.1 hypothetical protein FKR84_10585 [Haloflavibacter putidus]